MGISGEVSATSVEITPARILTTLKANRRLLGYITGSFVAAGIVLSLLLPNSYTAVTLLMPPSQSGSAINPLAALGASGAALASSFGVKNPADMYVGLLRSRTVADFVIHRSDLQAVYRLKRYSRVVKKLEAETEIEADQKSGLITLKVTDHDPRRAADIANSFIAGYNGVSAGLAITEASRRRKFFEDQLRQSKDNLTDAEQKLQELQSTAGIVEPNSQTRALIESGVALRAQIAAKQVEIQSMQSYATSENPQLQQTQRELEALRSQLASLESTKSEGSDSLVPSRGALQGASLEYVRRLREVKYDEAIFELLARQFELAKLDEARQGVEIQVVDPATPPDTKSGPMRSLIVALFLFLGVLSGAGWILLRDLRPPLS